MNSRRSKSAHSHDTINTVAGGVEQLGKQAIAVVIALVYSVASRRVETWRALHLPAGIALVALLVAPWWVHQWISDLQGFRHVVVDDNLTKYMPRSLTGALLTGPLQHTGRGD